MGVIYGPSGCGKSSLVRAGLLPHADDSVIHILLEATPDDTENQLLASLKEYAPFLKPKTSLRAALRRKNDVPPGKKLLIVLDQFEQWLHGRHESNYADLAEALPECDGVRIQCVLMIRDDFWTPLYRFLKSADIVPRENENARLVDLFDERHARRVLTMFGRAFEALPTDDSLSPAEEEFIETSISELAENGRVICVRLALFAQMVRRWKWEPGTLTRLGGSEGVGVAFLEESLSSKDAPAAVRAHQTQAEAVLKALLPEQGTDIKVARRSRAELLEASGYGQRPEKFAELIQILDTDLRLITPAEAIEEAEQAEATNQPSASFYQLTHDYLVPSLRERLTRKQKETRRGRAELRLEEHAELWTARTQRVLFPGPLGVASIWLLTNRKKWTKPQQEMMRHASRYYGIISAVMLLIIVLVTWGTIHVVAGRQADAFASRLFRQDNVEEASRVLEEDLGWFATWAVPILERRLQVTPPAGNAVLRNRLFREQSNAAVALAALGHTEMILPNLKQSADPTRRSYLINRYAASGGNPEALLRHLREKEEPSIRRALILTLGDFRKKDFADAEAFINLLLALHEQDPDPGIHSATHWVLRKWQRDESLGDEAQKEWRVITDKLATDKPESDRSWYVTKQGLTMAILGAGEYWYSDWVDGNLSHSDDLTPPAKQKLDHRFAISTTEVTVEQFRRFLQDKENMHNKQVSPEDASPMNSVDYFLAWEYCNWLTDEENKSRSDSKHLEKCYERDGQYGPMNFFRQRNGYRLPTDEEWAYACRASSSTEFSFGDADELLQNYACFSLSYGDLKSTHPVASLKPNDYGLFDMHGNLWEWCEKQHRTGEDGISGAGEDAGPLWFRVLRGGAFNLEAFYCRSAHRHVRYPEDHSRLGFRVSRNYP